MSPSVLFGSIWFFIITLQSFKILDFYVDVNYYFILIQLVILVAMTSFEFTFKVNISKIYKYDLSGISKLNILVKYILILMFIIDLIYSKGVPLIWILIGDSRTHVDFGMPTFHGIFHGILLYFATSSWLFYKLNIDKKSSFLNIIFFIIYACFVFNRGIVIIFLFQSFFITLILNYKSKLKLYFYGLLTALPLIYLFGILGDLRMGENVFLKSISSEWAGTFETIPPDLLWFYSYASGGLNNLYFNIDIVQPNFLPFYSFANMVPTVVYDLLGAVKGDPNFILADGRLTVSTAYQGFVSDFGYLGFFIYLPILIMAIVSYKYFTAGDLKNGMIYCMLMQTIVMTPYIDTFFYLTFLLQIILTIIIFNRFKFNE